MPPQDTLSAAELAQQYGWSVALLNSDPSLKSLFTKAVAETWAPEKFVAELRNTSWYKQNSDTAREMAVLRTTDPATYTQRVKNQRALLGQVAREMGAPVPGRMMQQIAEQSLMFGWNDQQIRQQMSAYLRYAGEGKLSGLAAQVEDDLRSHAQAMGVRISHRFITAAAQKVATGESSIEQFRDSLTGYAVSAFPHLAERFKAGETLAEIAEPYKQSMAQLLELNDESIDLFDPTLRAAFAGQTEEGKPSMKSLWQFENELRKDERWLKTNNAREQTMGVARQVLTDFGMAV